MKLENVRPMNFSGIPFALVVIAFPLIIILPRAMSEVWWPLWILGWLILSASWGTGVGIDGSLIVLKYVFGKLKIRIPFGEIEEITALSKLLARYFKWEIALFVICIIYAFFDLITMPRELLKGYYFGDIGLIIFGLFYIFAFILPFSRRILVGILAYLFILPILLYQKTGNITGDDISMFMVLAAILGFAILDIYGKDYILIRTKKDVYLLTCRSADNVIKTVLKVAQNVQTA